ncbi:MAG: hypothetical protein WCK46_00710 [Candidatus Adlerbacteria bacterium]
MSLEGKNSFLTPQQKKTNPVVKKERDELASQVKSERAKREPLNKEQGSMSHRAKAFFGRTEKRDQAIAEEKVAIQSTSKDMLAAGKERIGVLEEEVDNKEFVSRISEPLEILADFYREDRWDRRGRKQPEVVLDMQYLSHALGNKNLHEWMLFDLAAVYEKLVIECPGTPLQKDLEEVIFKNLGSMSLEGRPEGESESNTFFKVGYQYLRLISALATEDRVKLEPSHRAALAEAVNRVFDSNNPQYAEYAVKHWCNGLVSLIFSMSEDVAKKQAIFAAVDDIFAEGASRGFNMHEFNYLFGSSPEVIKYAAEKADPILRKIVDMSIADFCGSVDSPLLKEFRIGSLIESCKELEEELPGSVKRLIKDYGIKEFYRYPSKVLIKQLQEEEIDQPYGVVVFPRSDHNGAFDMDVSQIGEVFEQTQGKHALKVFEIESTFQLGRDLVGLAKKYPNNKISFAILGGHGAEDLIVFSKSKKLLQQDFEGPGHTRAGSFFVEDPSIILFSCSTGKEGGIAQKMSETFGARVIGPDIPTSPEAVSVTYQAEKPVFSVKYRSPDEEHKANPRTMSYSGGTLVEGQE